MCAIQPQVARSDDAGRKAPGFEEPGLPQPFIQTNGGAWFYGVFDFYSKLLQFLRMIEVNRLAASAIYMTIKIMVIGQHCNFI